MLIPSVVHGGAWTQVRGHGFYKLSEQVVRANRFYELSGNSIAIPTLADYTTGFYGEYGLTDRLTVIGYLPFLKRITLNRQIERGTGFVFFPGDDKTGIADTDIGIRVGLLQGDLTAVSVQVILGLPIGDHRQINGLFTGDGEFNQLLTLQVGRSLYPAPLYVTGEIGINHRLKGYSEELRYAVELGYTIRKKLTIAAHLRGVESFNNGDRTITGGTGGLYGNNQRYLSYGPEISYMASRRIGFTAGVDGVAHGKNVLAAPSYTLGIIAKM